MILSEKAATFRDQGLDCTDIGHPILVVQLRCGGRDIFCSLIQMNDASDQTGS